MLVAVQQATAWNFSGANGMTGCSPAWVNMADNNYHTFYYSGLVPTTAEAQDSARIYHYDGTDVDTVVVGTLTTATDAVIYDANYTTWCGYNWDGGPGNNIWGVTHCVSINSADECEKHHIRYDDSDIDGLSYEGRAALACHETGHSLGLFHRDEEYGCMITSSPYPNNLTVHDALEINAHY